MASELEQHPIYVNTIQRLEAVKRKTDGGVDYWMARDIHPLLGYPVWDKFEPVIDRAAASLKASGLEPSHHIAQTSKMLGLGMGAERKGIDYFLNRGACRLIAMNGDPSKPEIAAAQAYFVVQTHRMEQQDAMNDDEKRLELRHKVGQSHRRVSKAAQDAGVRSKMQGVFHDGRYQGLYDMSLQEVRFRKGLKDGEQLYDRAEAMELSAHDFQMNLAAEAIRNERIRGEQAAIRKNKQVAQEVRKVMKEQGSPLPENLPLATDPIKVVKKRVEARKKLLIKT